MSEIVTIWNKGKRTWTFKNANGEQVRLSPNESMEMEATQAVRLVESYHRDFSTSKVTGVSSSDLARREQSIKDREAALKEKLADFEAREKALAEKEAGNAGETVETTETAEHKKRGRKPKAETQEAE